MKGLWKRLAALLLCLAIGFTFAACGTNPPPGPGEEGGGEIVTPGPDDKDPDDKDPDDKDPDDKDPDDKDPDDEKDGDIVDRGKSGPILTGKAYSVPALENAPLPYGPVPSASQMKYYEQGLSMFVHFGINTFTNAEWGDGKEDPKDFAPTGLNTDQWIETAKDMGFGRVIFTAKHHDGFVNYPTEYTSHSVASSDWLGGKGDVLKAFIDSCAKYDMDAGIYLSPWDRNMPSYSTAVKPAYNDTYVNMIDEIFEKYGNETNGNIVEFWLDGACGDTSTRPVYDYARWWETIYGHNNDIVIKSEYGSSVHWIGDKECSLGWAGDQVWSTFNNEYLWSGFPTKPSGFNEYINNGTPYIEGKTGKENANIWSVAEADISIRTTAKGETGAWFWSPDDKTRTVEDLIGKYFDSVGKGGVFLLNVPPTREGVFEKCDLDALAAFREILDNTFGTDKAAGARATASNTRLGSESFAAGNVTDGNYDTYWATDDDRLSGTVTVEFDSPVYMDVVELQEYIPLGQRIKNHKVEVKVGDGWMDFGSGTTVGYKRLVKGVPVYANAVRVSVEGYAAPLLNHIGVYKADSRIEEKAQFTAPGTISACDFKSKTGGSTDVKNQTKGGRPNVGSIKNGNTITYEKIFFNGRPDTIGFSYAGAGNPAGADVTVTAYLDSIDGTVIATCDLPATGGYYKYATAEFEVTYDGDISGYHNLCLSFQGGAAAGENAGLNLESIIFGMNDTVSLEQPEIFVDSSAQTAQIKLVRSSPTQSPVTVSVATRDGIGIAGVNYGRVNETVTFAAGESEKTVAVNLLGFDGVTKGLYDFALVVGDVSDGAYIGALTETTVTVVDTARGVNYGIGTNMKPDSGITASGKKVEDGDITSTEITIKKGTKNTSGKIIKITTGEGDGFVTTGEKQVVRVTVKNGGAEDIMIRYYVTNENNDLIGVTVTVAAGETVEAFFSLEIAESQTPIGCAVLVCSDVTAAPVTVTGYVIN